VCVITSGRTRGAEAEEDAIGKQQLATEADTIGKQQAETGEIGEQQLKQTQCTVLGAAAGADAIGVPAVRSDHARIVLARDTIPRKAACCASE